MFTEPAMFLLDSTSTKELKALSKFLMKLSKKRISIFDRDRGICELIHRKFDRGIFLETFIREMYVRWPYFSGNKAFPVPMPKVREAAVRAEICGIKYDKLLKEAAIISFCTSRNKWIGEYGELRRDLCRHIANELNTYLEKR